jgi:L-asparaginase
MTVVHRRQPATRRALLPQVLAAALIAACWQGQGSLAQAADLPDITILATGGTIAGMGESSTGGQYKPSKVPIEDLLNAVPDIHKIATVKGEQVVQIASQAMTPELWQRLGRRANELLAGDIDGVIVTHGTDTMEETAYFLDLVVHSDKPVVLVGSMRPATAISADGPRNLYNAVTLAGSAEARGKGVLITMNDTILPARGTTKRNTTNVATFIAPDSGPMGTVGDGKVTFYDAPLRKHTAQSELSEGTTALPPVAILYGYAGDSSPQVKAVADGGAKGIVFAGVGNGNFNPNVETALAEARQKGIAVVRSSRVGSGAVTRDAEVDDQKLGFVVADDLSPQQARVLLMLGLVKTSDPAELQRLFFTY